MNDKLPYLCEKHPEAQIRHEYDETTYSFGLTGYSNKQNTNHKYFCNECNKRLAPPKGEPK